MHVGGLKGKRFGVGAFTKTGMIERAKVLKSPSGS